jgi:O-antigen/teichoic acid export membrane protein
VTMPRSVLGRMMSVVAHRVRRYLPQGQLTRGVLILVFGIVAAQGIVVLSSPILTRLYDPADLGTLSVYTAILSVLVTITCLSYELAIPLPEDETEAANTLALCLLVNLVTSLIAAVILIALAPLIVSAFDVPALGPIIWLIAVGQFAGGAAIALINWSIRDKRFTQISGSNVLQAAVLVAVQLGIGVVSATVVGLIVADIASRLSASVALGTDAVRTHRRDFGQVTRRGIVEVARRYRRFPILSSPSALINTLGLQAPTLLIVALYGPDVGGQLFLAMRVAALPVTLLARSVGQVYTSEAARIARDDPGQLRGLFIRTTTSLTRAGIGPTALLAVLAPILFPFVFGDEWQQAGWFTTILAPMYLLTLATSPTGATLDVLERQDLHLVREVLRLILVGGAVVLASAIRLPAVGAVALFSVAGCFTYVFYGAVSWWAIESADRKRRRSGPAAA